MLESVPPRARTPGRGELVFARAGGRTVVARAAADSPLKLLCPRSHGDGRWVFAATFGGGLVDGDAIDLEVRVGEGARALLGTQASTKVYRSPRLGARQRIVATVEDGAALVVAPDPVACFAGARYEQRATYALAPTASLVVADVVSCGRSARGERWAFARLASRTTVERSGEVVAVDAAVLDAAHGDLARRMGRFDAIATVIALGPAARPVRDAILAKGGAKLAPRAATAFAASPLGDDGAIARAAGEQIEAVIRAVRDLLAGAAALFGDDPFARKR